MSLEELFVILQRIEILVEASFTLFGSYKLVKKDELLNKFKMLYDALPQELISSRDYLNSQKEENIFSLLRQVSVMIEQSKTYFGCILVDQKAILSFIDKIYVTLPEDILICRGDED